MDEQFFIYWEDAEWCHRMHDHGWQVLVEPAASVVHYRGRVGGAGRLRGAGVSGLARSLLRPLRALGAARPPSTCCGGCAARRGAIADGRTASRLAGLPHGDVDRCRSLHHGARSRARPHRGCRAHPGHGRRRRASGRRPRALRQTGWDLLGPRARRGVEAARSRSVVRANSRASRARCPPTSSTARTSRRRCRARTRSSSPCTT